MRQLGSGTLVFLFANLLLLPDSGVIAGDWPMFGRDQTRNPVSPERGAAMFWQIETRDERGRVTEAARNIRWCARLGSTTYGDPVVANGLVWVGTNNGRPGDGQFRRDASVLMCFRESDGRLVYRYESPRLENNRSCDWPFASLACSPLIEKDRLWFTTNRCQTVCLDIGPLLRKEGEARVVWKIDMMKELGVHPLGSLMSVAHCCSPAGYRDYIYVITGNGVDESGAQVPAPAAPSLVCLSKESGKVVWQDNSPGKHILGGQWASPLAIEIGGQGQVMAPLGDGWLRSFDALTGKLLWEFDMNPKEAKGTFGRGTRNGVLATPVCHDGRIYISSGRHPADPGNGVGRLCCIDPSKRGDISAELAVDARGKVLPRRRDQAVDRVKGEKAVPNSNSGLIWDFIHRGREDTNTMHGSVGNVAVHAGLVIAADNQGYVHCLDARTGKKHWTCDTREQILSSPLIVDGKVYVTLRDGQVVIFQLSADPTKAMRKPGHQFEPIASIEMPSGTRTSPVFANGTLYVATDRELFAIREDDSEGKGAHGYWPQWRGPDRTNVSREKGLLQQWPVEGPPLLWRAAPLGQGIAPVSIAAGRIFTSGYQDGKEFAIALDEQTGQRVWGAFLSSSIPQVAVNRLMRWLSQRAPTVDGDRLYYVTSAGDLICLRSADGKELWRKSYPGDFKARMPAWTFCDTPLVDGDQLICMPGGPEAALVALNKQTGAVIWKSAGLGRALAGYSPVMVADIGGVRQYVALVGGGLAGFAAKDGKILWHYDRIASSWNSHAPIIRGDQIFCTNGYGGGMALVKLVRRGEGFHVEEQYYRKERISSIQDSSVPLALGDYAYDFHQTRGLICIEIKTGKTVWQSNPPTAQSRGMRGSLTYANGCLYVRDSSGGVTLIPAAPKEYLVKSTFKVPGHQESLGATAPVIAGGRLYLREEEALYCYDIRASSAARPRQEARTVTLPPFAAPGKGATVSDGPHASKKRSPDALFVPTPHEVVDKMLELAGTKKTDLVYDLGSGDGRIVIAAARKYGCKAVGYEIDPELVKLSRQEIQKSQLQNLVRIEAVDFFTIDLSSADVIALYLPPRVLERLLPQLAKLKPGARIVSHYFEIPGYKPEQVATVNCKEDGSRHTVYLWTAPLKKTK